MKPQYTEHSQQEMAKQLKERLSKSSSERLGMLTSVDGSQLALLMLDPETGKC